MFKPVAWCQFRVSPLERAIETLDEVNQKIRLLIEQHMSEPSLKVDVDFRAATAIGVSALARMRHLILSALADSSVEDDFHGLIRSKALAKVMIKICVAAGDDKEGAPHSASAPHHRCHREIRPSLGRDSMRPRHDCSENARNATV